MERSTSKVEAMKPVLMKAGIPVAIITVIGFVLAKIAGRKYLVSKSPSLSEIQESSVEIDSEEMYGDDEQSFHTLDSASLPCVESDSAFTGTCHENSLETLHMQEEEIYGLRSQVQELNMRFLRYQNLKEQEMVLMEIQNKLRLGIMRVGFFTSEISLMEAEIQRFGLMAIEFLQIMGLLEFLRSENALLHKRAKKLLRRNKEQYHVLRKQNLQIIAKEREISRARKELEMKDNCIKNMADEIRELKIATEQLQGEKNDLLSKLAEKSPTSKIEGREMTLENYNQLASEVEQLHKDRAAETEEFIYLRWCNACLRHRRNTEQDEIMEENDHVDEIAEYGSDHELISSSRLGHGGDSDSCSNFPRGNHAQSKRRKLIAKLKRWVEGSEKMKKKMDEKEQQENMLARKSCSSA